jgi:nitrogen-specific signal transduction histidine kinase/integral membrane sensor domain MASE1
MGVERIATVPGRGEPRPVTVAVRLLVFSALAYAAFLVGRDTVMASANVSVIWPLSGVGLVWLTSGGRRLWLVDAAGLGIVAVVATLIDIPDAPRAGWIMAAVLTVLQPAVYVLVMRRVAPDLWGSGGTRAMSTLRDLGWFVVACLVGSVTAGLVRASGLGLVPGQDLVTATMTWVRNFAWMISIGAVALQVAPALARLRSWGDVGRVVRASMPATGRRTAEIALILMVTAGIYLTLFSLPITFLLTLVTVWAAMRLSPAAATLHGLASGFVAVLLTVDGHGAFFDVDDARVAAALSQSFLIGMVITAVVVAFITQDRRDATTRAQVSERKAAERADLLNTVMDNMREGLVVVQDDGKILVRNPAGRVLVGLDDTEPDPDVMPAAAYGFFAPDGSPLSDDEMPAALAFAGIEVVNKDYLMKTRRFPEGRVLEMSVSHLPRLTPGERRRVVINYRDVTLTRQDRDNLSSFAGVVAHDLLNPLSIVDGWAEALNEAFLEGPVDPADGGAMITRIQGASRHMRRFIDDLLSYTVARDHPLRIEDVDLSALTESIAALRRQGDSRPRIHVQPDMRVMADTAMMRQLLDNLIGNAVKYVAPGVRPHIIISAQHDGDNMLLTVDDNGIGVPPEQRRSIFENFQRAALEYTGTGIGLAICQRIVERHGGRIVVEDNPHGDGSRFALTLPGVATAPALAAPVDESAPRPA